MLINPSQDRSLMRSALLLTVFFLLQACGDSRMADLKEFVNTAYQDKKPEIEPLPAFQPYKAYRYPLLEDTDPFSIGNIISGGENSGGVFGERPNADREREPLEDYPLDALALVGTMTQEDVNWVIVRTNEGTAHLAKVGNYLGQNDGQIKQILPDEERVVLVETVPDPSGRWVSREVEITIDE